MDGKINLQGDHAMESNWSVFKEYINSKKIGNKIYRKLVKEEIKKHITMSSFDRYCRCLTKLCMLEYTGRGKYILKQHIPERMNTTIMLELLSKYPHWQYWFMPIEDRVDRLLKRTSKGGRINVKKRKGKSNGRYKRQVNSKNM